MRNQISEIEIQHLSSLATTRFRVGRVSESVIMRSTSPLIVSLCFIKLALSLSPITSSDLLNAPVVPRGLFKRLSRLEQLSNSGRSRAEHLATLSLYPVQYFSQLVTHDEDYPSTVPKETFQQRYWFDPSFYIPGGPIIVLDGGETDATGRLEFMSSGILKIIAQETGGMR
jgi:hypothetical protein